jgi:pimeloyl-ACP methyl ester carboxylesterase
MGGPRSYESWSNQADPALPVWDIRGDRSDGPEFILTHGWGDSRIGALSRIAALVPHASRILAWDMRGHGDAPGTSTLGVREVDDLCSLMAFVAPERPLILVGWSMGAGVSIAAASRGIRKVDAVIAEAPYRLARTPAERMLVKYGLPADVALPAALLLLGMKLGIGRQLLSGKGFDRAAFSSQLACPLLVIHGDADDICPVADGRIIAETAPTHRLLLVPDGRHQGLWSDPRHRQLCTQAVAAFLAEFGLTKVGLAASSESSN